MKNLSLKILLILISILLFGCGTEKETVQVYLKCDENTNGGNAVVVTIYQLINSDKFRLSSFSSLTKNPETTLGSDLVINSKLERTMVPGERDTLEITKEAAFIGIIADFHTPSADGWRQLIPLNKDFDQLVVTVHKNSISYNIEN